jgi:peptidoglycan hydrolase CwlO-like protein
MKLVQPEYNLWARKCVLRYDIHESEQQEADLERQIEALKAKVYDLQRSRAEMQEKLAALEQEQPENEVAG